MDILDLQDQDESVRIAVRALGDMRNIAQAARGDPVASTSPSDNNSPFVSRVSHLPIVNSALRVYEQGKASSRVVKYGAEMMESSVKTISRPVIDRLPVNVNQLDEFACRQLDRLDRYRRPSSDDFSNAVSPPTSPVPSSSNRTQPIASSSTSFTRDLDRPKVKLKSTTLDESAEDVTPDTEGGDHFMLSNDWRGTGKDGVPSWLQGNSPFVGPPPPPPDLSSTTSTQPQSEERQVARRSRWQAVLLEAGGLSAALSEESMRRLKYCLQWLQYATAHIDAQILILRDFTARLQPLSPTSQTRNGHPPISHAHLRTLTAVRRDIVHTIRQVVDVVSRYAGGALPEPARGRVRGFILQLPQRWARKAGPTPGSSRSAHEEGERERDREREHEREMERETVAAAAAGGGRPVRRGNRRAAGRERGTGAGAVSTPSSRATSPVMRHPRHQEETGEPVSAGAAIVAAQRILTLATESLDMMRGVTGVVKDSLDRADAWVGRFRTVGIQRGATQDGGEEASAVTPSGSHNPDGLEQRDEFAHMRRHRRDESSGSQFDDDGMLSPYSGASTYSSYAGESSIPSTPGAGTYTPAYAYAQGQYTGASGGYTGNAPSPDAVRLGLGSMTLSASRFSTPRSMAGGLPDVGEDGEDNRMLGQETVGPRKGVGVQVDEVKIVGMDVEIGDSEGQEDGKGPAKMDVDA